MERLHPLNLDVSHPPNEMLHPHDDVARPPSMELDVSLDKADDCGSLSLEEQSDGLVEELGCSESGDDDGDQSFWDLAAQQLCALANDVASNTTIITTSSTGYPTTRSMGMACANTMLKVASGSIISSRTNHETLVSTVDDTLPCVNTSITSVPAVNPLPSAMSQESHRGQRGTRASCGRGSVTVIATTHEDPESLCSPTTAQYWPSQKALRRRACSDSVMSRRCGETHGRDGSSRDRGNSMRCLDSRQDSRPHHHGGTGREQERTSYENGIWRGSNDSCFNIGRRESGLRNGRDRNSIVGTSNRTSIAGIRSGTSTRTSTAGSSNGTSTRTSTAGSSSGTSTRTSTAGSSSGTSTRTSTAGSSSGTSTRTSTAGPVLGGSKGCIRLSEERSQSAIQSTKGEDRTPSNSRKPGGVAHATNKMRCAGSSVADMDLDNDTECDLIFQALVRQSQ